MKKKALKVPKTPRPPRDRDIMRDEYDFSNAVRLRDTPKFRRWVAAAAAAKTKQPRRKAREP
jgi:hypothetical protein